ncbi:MAG: hypothetical protein JWO15_3874 [Sphingomonadales bacterium]|nr:hypothetical protein [Sphingomonadales bacterium]
MSAEDTAATNERETLAVETACEVMHDAYEAAAVGAGWETQKASRKPWADVPEANKATMRAAVSALLAHLAATQRPDDREATLRAAIWESFHGSERLERCTRADVRIVTTAVLAALAAADGEATK